MVGPVFWNACLVLVLKGEKGRQREREERESEERDRGGGGDRVRREVDWREEGETGEKEGDREMVERERGRE